MTPAMPKKTLELLKLYSDWKDKKIIPEACGYGPNGPDCTLPGGVKLSLHEAVTLNQELLAKLQIANEALVKINEGTFIKESQGAVRWIQSIDYKGIRELVTKALAAISLKG